MAKLGEANIGGRLVPAWLLDLTAEELDGLKWYSKPNLLDNWYFVGGGSQQGGGQFPINQRGETSWSQGSAFDRWLISKPSGSEATVTLSEDGVSASAPCYFFERLEGKWLAGKQLTLSALLDSGELLFGTVTFNQQNSVATNNGEFSLYMENLSSTSFTVFVIRWITASEKKVVAAKLELGDQQTLAYQDEEGNWQLFEAPDYGDQLRRCQRYFQRIKASSSYMRFGVSTPYSSTSAGVFIPLLGEMRKIPVVSFGGNFALFDGQNFHPVTLSSDTLSPYNAILTASGSTQPTKAAQLLAYNDSTAYIDFSADL